MRCDVCVGGNPAFKLYDIDPDTLEVLDAKVFMGTLFRTLSVFESERVTDERDDSQHLRSDLSDLWSSVLLSFRCRLSLICTCQQRLGNSTTPPAIPTGHSSLHSLTPRCHPLIYSMRPSGMSLLKSSPRMKRHSRNGIPGRVEVEVSDLVRGAV